MRIPRIDAGTAGRIVCLGLLVAVTACVATARATGGRPPAPFSIHPVLRVALPDSYPINPASMRSLVDSTRERTMAPRRWAIRNASPCRWPAIMDTPGWTAPVAGGRTLGFKLPRSFAHDSTHDSVHGG